VADPPRDPDPPLGALLDGWDTPSPRADFADRVLAATRPPPVRWSRYGWAALLVLGGAVGGFATARAGASARGDELDIEMRSAAEIRVIAERRAVYPLAGIADVVVDAGGSVRWVTTPGGVHVLEVEHGVVLVRVAAERRGLVLRTSDGDQTLTPGTCSRVAVTHGMLVNDIEIDMVSCETIEAAIDAP
jgi:hypothetical protein